MSPIAYRRKYLPDSSGEGALIGRAHRLVRTGGVDYRCACAIACMRSTPAYRLLHGLRCPHNGDLGRSPAPPGNPLDRVTVRRQSAHQEFTQTDRAYGHRKRAYRFACETRSIAKPWLGDLGHTWFLSPKPLPAKEVANWAALDAVV